MSKKLKIIIGILIGVIVITLIVIGVINIQKDKKIAEENISMINKNYEELTSNVRRYNKNREDLANKLSSLFYDSYGEEHQEYQELINEYNENMIKIDKNIYQINARCDRLYKDSTINEICNNYKLTYEKIVNLYVSDLDNMNAKVKKYNEIYDKSLGLFEMVHVAYIDYNENGVYEGKSN